jgi:hypothetical protein
LRRPASQCTGLQIKEENAMAMENRSKFDIG